MLKVITPQEAEKLIENKSFDYVKFDYYVDTLIPQEPEIYRRCVIDEKYVLYADNAKYIEKLYNYFR